MDNIDNNTLISYSANEMRKLTFNDRYMIASSLLKKEYLEPFQINNFIQDLIIKGYLYAEQGKLHPYFGNHKINALQDIEYFLKYNINSDIFKLGMNFYKSK